MKFGVICPSEIALRRFMPSLKYFKDIEFVGIGVCSVTERFGDTFHSPNSVNEVMRVERAKAQTFIDQYGGKIFESYENIAISDEIEALYIPLPPALHYKWAKKALENFKHVFVEKPATISAVDTRELVDIADSNGLALHENYMFTFHDQLKAVNQIIASKEIGDVRLYRISFGFPRREVNDFRYNKALGGGALFDAGGYVIKYATILLGKTAIIKYAKLNYIDGYEVDIYGSATVVNEDGVTAQIAFGIDNNYKCELEVWGSTGYLTTGRIFTAPVGFVPRVTIRKNDKEEVRNLPADDTFKKSINRFLQCTTKKDIRKANYEELVRQSIMVEEFIRKANFRK